MIVRICAALLLLAAFLAAQTAEPPLPANAIFAGAGLAPSGTGNAEHAVGTAGYLTRVASNTYAFARYDILGLNKKPVGLQTVVTAGACEILHQIGPVFLGGCLDGGTAVAGANIGGAIGADATAGIRFGTTQRWAFVIQGGVMKTALGQAVNPIRAVFVYGWGK